MELCVVHTVLDDHFVIESGRGDQSAVSKSGVDWPVQAGMPILRAKDASVHPYSGVFFDEEDGAYKKLAVEGGRFVLKERRAPHSSDELKAFLIELVKTNDTSLGDSLDMAIEDLLARGETELAFMLMNRQEAVAPSESMKAMAARYRREKRETAAKKGCVRTLNRA